MRSIGIPTTNAWIAGRIQINGEDDYPFVHSLQNRMELTSLSSWIVGERPSPELAMRSSSRFVSHSNRTGVPDDCGGRLDAFLRAAAAQPSCARRRSYGCPVRSLRHRARSIAGLGVPGRRPASAPDQSSRRWTQGGGRVGAQSARSRSGTPGPSHWMPADSASTTRNARRRPEGDSARISRRMQSLPWAGRSRRQAAHG